jgi:MFS superfamily sulfate permease-like transporter
MKSLMLKETQLDELWAFVKKRKVLTSKSKKKKLVENGRVVKVETKIVFGSAERIKKRIEALPSNTINTSKV